jgi:hypothetical protein
VFFGDFDEIAVMGQKQGKNSNTLSLEKMIISFSLQRQRANKAIASATIEQRAINHVSNQSTKRNSQKIRNDIQ